MYSPSSTEPLSRQGQGGTFTLTVPEEGIQPIYHQTANKTTVLSGQRPFANQGYPTQVREQIGDRAQHTVIQGQTPTIVQTKIFTEPLTTTNVVTESTAYRQNIGDREPDKPRGLVCSLLTFILAAVCVVAFSIFFMASQRHQR